MENVQLPPEVEELWRQLHEEASANYDALAPAGVDLEKARKESPLGFSLGQIIRKVEETIAPKDKVTFLQAFVAGFADKL